MALAAFTVKQCKSSLKVHLTNNNIAPLCTPCLPCQGCTLLTTKSAEIA